MFSAQPEALEAPDSLTPGAMTPLTRSINQSCLGVFEIACPDQKYETIRNKLSQNKQSVS